MIARPPLRNVNDMVLALLLLLAGVGPGGVGLRGVAGQLSAKPTRGPHPSSPCPSVFSYEGREPEKNRWYGVILVTTDEPLDGVRINVRLTHRAQILGNYIGDVSTSDNIEYTILNLKQRLSPGPPLPVRIFAAFGDRDDIPYIANIKLNGRTICGSNNLPDLGLDSGSRPLTTSGTPDRIGKPGITRPAGIGGAGGGAGNGSGGNAGIAAAHQFDEEPRPRPPPTPPASTTRTTSTPAPTARPNPIYEPAPNVNPDNYYTTGNSGGSGESYSHNQYDSTTKRPMHRPIEEDVYQQPVNNYTSTPEPERGVYRPAASKRPAARPPIVEDMYSTTERASPVYTPTYKPPRTTPTPRPHPPRQPPPYRPESQTSPPGMSRRPTPPPTDADVSSPPQPWPTSNYNEAALVPDVIADAAPSRPSSQGLSRPPRSTCGTIAPPATPLIINGETSIPGKWPWHVALYKPQSRDWKYQCGGSLVSPTVVVTAAHCVTTTVGRPVGPESLLVFLGKHALRTTSEDGVQDKHVYFIHVHPGYNYTNYRNDIAVLILSSPATITAAVRPVCLWDKDKTDLSHVEGKFGTVVGWRTDLAQPETDSDKVVGWGIETDGLLTEELHQALMPVVSPAICVYSYPSFFGVYTNNQTYCAGYSPDQPAAGTSVCNGDSGGGMFFKQNEDVPDDEAVWMMRGLVSLSVRTKQDRCDPSHFVVFTDVAKYVDWLEGFLVP